MSLHPASSFDDTLSTDNPSESTQLESFPPLCFTRSNVLNSPSIKLDPILPKLPEQETQDGSKRWLILCLSCLLLFGNYFAYDNPAALNTQLQEYLGMPYNEYQYLLSTLYSIYSLPNTVLPFVFGSLLDKLGPRRVLLVLSGCVCLGQTLFSIGVQSRQVWSMLLGRAIFGIGGESCAVAQASITTTYFRGHELAFALGLNLCIARFGSVINTIVTPWAEQKWDVPTAVWVGTLSCLGSFLSAVALTTLIGTTTPSKDMEETENYPLLSGVTGVTTDDTDRTDDMNSEMYLTAPLANEEDQNLLSPHSQVPFQPPIIPQFPGILRREASFVESINSVRFSPGIAKSGTRPSLYITTDRSSEQETWWSQWWSDLKFFPSTFWLLCALTVLLYGTVVPFNNIASDFLQSKWYHNNPRKAAAVMGIPDTLGAILVPGFGLVVDRFGRRASALIASALIMVIVHTTLGFTTLSPIFAFSLLGIAYTMYGVALWPSIACVITSELHLGKGYGISSSFLNITLTVVPPIVATIRVVGESFIPVEMFFIFTGLCGVLVGFALKAIDRRDGGKLEVPEIQVEVPVIVPQSSGCGPNSTAPSPSISQKRLKKRNRPALPTLDMYRITSSDLNDLEMRKNGGEGSIAQNSSSSLSRKARDDSDCPTASRSSALFRNSPSNLSHASERLSKQGWWKSRPSLHKSLAGIGSPLLQQYTASPRYGSMSSPSLSAVIRDDMWDIENGAKLESGSQGYSVSQHPILYNPLRGSSGSFRISRSARLIAFGEGEEGCIYVDGQAIETGHEDQSNASESDSETEDRVVNEQAGGSTSFSSEVNREGEDDITITTSSNTLTEDATEPL